MKKFLLLLLSISFHLSAYKYELAICSVFQDDAKYIPEWIDFHEKMGVEHFYLYNNNSSDDFMSFLLPYIQQGKVDLYDWNHSYSDETDWTFVQTAAFMDCVNKTRKKVKWCAFLDTDEFLFSPYFIDLRRMLEQYDNYPGIEVHWVMYGHSNVQSINPGEKMLDLLCWRKQFESKTTKTIAKPIEIEACSSSHFFIYKNGNHSVNENYIPLDNSNRFNLDFTANYLRINHYWSRDMDFFFHIKIPRRQKWKWSIETLLEWEASMHHTFDPILKGF